MEENKKLLVGLYGSMFPNGTNYCMKCNREEHLSDLMDKFQWYLNDFEDSEEAIALKRQYLTTAKEIVEGYLGYSLDIHDVEEEHISIHSKDIYLREFPVEEVYAVKINGKYVPAPHVERRGDHVRVHACIPCNAEIEVQYCAGYRKIPDIVEQTIFRLASLLKTEANGNIGLTSRSYGNDGSRSYLNYTSYAKYLEPLYPLRSTKLT